MNAGPPARPEVPPPTEGLGRDDGQTIRETVADLSPTLPESGRVRPVVEVVRPRVDGGRFPAKSSLGDVVIVEADVFADGHDELACEVRFQPECEHRWTSAPMVLLGNDRWRGRFSPERLGRYRFHVRAVVDEFVTWRRDLLTRAAARQDLSMELAVGAELVQAAAGRAKGADRGLLGAVAEQLLRAPRGLESDLDLAEMPFDAGVSLRDLLTSAGLGALVGRYRTLDASESSQTLAVVVDPARALLQHLVRAVPSLGGPEAGRHGTFADVERRLGYLAALGIRRPLPAADASHRA